MSAERLLNAVKNNEFQELSLYLTSENDEDVNTKDGEGWTLLHYAVINGNIYMVKVLLKNGADPTQVTDEGDTPLHVASRKGCTEIVNILLKHASVCGINYIDTKTTLHGDTPLHIAAKNGFTDIVNSLLSHGAIYNIKNTENQTPSDLSKAHSVLKILDLIQESFDKAKNGNMEIISTFKNASLDEFSAIIKSHNCENQPLIQVAMVNNNHKLTAALLEMRVDIHSDLNSNEVQTAALGSLSENDANSKAKDKLEHLRTAAIEYLCFSGLYLPTLRALSQPSGEDKNSDPGRSLKEGSYLLKNIQDLVDSYKKYMPGKIEEKNIKLVNDTLIYLQFDRSHIRSGFLQDAFGTDGECFISTGQNTVYYDMLHSDLNKDVRLFIDIVEKNLDTPVRRFLETIKQKLKIFS